MKTAIATILAVGGVLLIVSTLFLDYRQHNLTCEVMGFGLGVLSIAIAAVLAWRRAPGGHADDRPRPTWADVGMLFVTFAGFALTIYMIYDAAEAFKSSNYSNASPMILDLDKEFVEHPELRPYFYQDGTNQVVRANPGDTNYVQVMAMSEYMLDTFDSFLAQRVRYGHQKIDTDWTDWMKDTFSHSPTLAHYMKEHKNWYKSGELYKVYQEWVHKDDSPDH